MAFVKMDETGIEVLDGSNLRAPTEDLGVQFGCRNGFCRTCEVTVIEGYGNLTELSENEDFIGLIKPRRLMCQCRIKSGTIKIIIE